MTIKELIKELSVLDPSLIVVMSRDEEGNRFMHLGEIATNNRYADGEIGLETLTDALRMQGFTEEDLMEHGQPAVVLWPRYGG